MYGAVDKRMLNSSGDRGEPCGSPLVGVIVCDDVWLSCLIVIDLFVRKECMSLQKCVVVCGSRVLSTAVWHVRSKACCMSSEMTKV